MSVRDTMPPDQGLVTEHTALLAIDATAARLGRGSWSVDTTPLPDGAFDEGDDAACVQMFIRLAGAVEDGYAEEVGEPDDDGNRLLRITPAGIARLDHYRGAS